MASDCIILQPNFKNPALLHGAALLPCDLSLVTIPVSDCRYSFMILILQQVV